MSAWVVRGRVIRYIDPEVPDDVTYDALLDAVWCGRLLRFTLAVTGMAVVIGVVVATR